MTSDWRIKTGGTVGRTSYLFCRICDFSCEAESQEEALKAFRVHRCKMKSATNMEHPEGGQS